MANAELHDPKYQRLLKEKADRLDELEKRKPGEKQYKAKLKAFLDADAKAQKALMTFIERELDKRLH